MSDTIILNNSTNGDIILISDTTQQALNNGEIIINYNENIITVNDTTPDIIVMPIETNLISESNIVLNENINNTEDVKIIVNDCGDKNITVINNEKNILYELMMNKVQNLLNPNPFTYPSTLAVKNAIDTIMLSGGDKNFVFIKNIASTTWTIYHGLNKIPSVNIYNYDGFEVEGDVVIVDNNNLIINFNIEVSGKAVLN